MAKYPTQEEMAELTASGLEAKAKDYFDKEKVFKQIKTAATNSFSHLQIEQKEALNFEKTEYAQTLVKQLHQLGFEARFQVVHRPENAKHGGIKNTQYKELYISWHQGEVVTSLHLHDGSSADYLPQEIEP
jgi:hypothetical protein